MSRKHEQKRDILDIIDQHKDQPGINIHKLKPGTKIKVHTIFSLYELIVSNKPGYLFAKGGKYIPEVKTVYFSGSTYGGSMLKIGWIGQDMQMEIWVEPHKCKLTTSRVQKATVIGDGWEYSLWDD